MDAKVPSPQSSLFSVSAFQDQYGTHMGIKLQRPCLSGRKSPSSTSLWCSSRIVLFKSLGLSHLVSNMPESRIYPDSCKNTTTNLSWIHPRFGHIRYQLRHVPSQENNILPIMTAERERERAYKHRMPMIYMQFSRIIPLLFTKKRLIAVAFTTGSIIANPSLVGVAASKKINCQLTITPLIYNFS